MMLKYLYIPLFLCIISLPLCLSSCTKFEHEPEPEAVVIKASEDEDNRMGAILIDAFTNLTEGKFENAITLFSEYKSLKNMPNLAVEVGMGKAYFGMEEYSNAEKAFEAAYSIAPDRTDIIHYLGEAQMQIGNYSAAIKTFNMHLNTEPEDKSAISKLEQSLRQNRDYIGLYEFIEDRLAVTAENDMERDSYYIKLVEAAQLTKDADLIETTIARFNNTPFGTVLNIGQNIYSLLLSGDEDSIKEFLSEKDTIEAVIGNAGRYSCYFGEYNDDGEYCGIGVTVFGANNRNSICQVYYGEFNDGVPNGKGIGYRGDIYEWENEGKAWLEKDATLIETEWKNGVLAPKCDVIKTLDYVIYSENKIAYSGKDTVTAPYIDGLAQGEVWTEERWKSTYGTYVTYRQHFVVDGRPVPFEVTYKGRTVMVYEATYYDNKNRIDFVREGDCGCRFEL